MGEDSVSIELNTSNFDKIKSKAIKAGDEYCDEGEDGKSMLLNNLRLDSESDERYLNIKENKFVFSGSLVDIDTEENVGYLSFDLDLDAETLLELINIYMKKLGKVKTVLEAVKDE